MSFRGKAIKAALNINQSLEHRLIRADTTQEECLKGLLNTAKDTAFGKYYGFAQILKASDLRSAYAAAVPIHDYDKMHTEWWAQQLTLPDITWPGHPSFFALSSGTTGKESKRIPITNDFIDGMRRTGVHLLGSLPNFDFPESVFEGEFLMLSSSADLKDHPAGHKEGEISGISVSNFPDYYDFFYRPGHEIAAISDWNERVARIVAEAPNWNISAIAGIPSWVLLLLKEVIKGHGLNTIHDLWPNLHVYASGGVAYDTYREDFDAICARPLTIIDTYLASEGFFAYTARPGTMDMKLVMDEYYYYEFIPFDGRGVDDMGNILENPVIQRIEEVEQGKDYVLLITTSAGAWRYVIGDTIRFTDVKSREIKITGRTKFFLNVVGSQLSEEKMDAGILEAAQAFGITVNEYSVAAVKNESGDYVHQWIVVAEKQVDEGAFAEKLDEALKNLNKNYSVARSKALKGVRVKAINKAMYHAYLEKSKKKGGQVKTQKVMGAEKMEAYLSFVNEAGVSNKLCQRLRIHFF